MEKLGKTRVGLASAELMHQCINQMSTVSLRLQMDENKITDGHY